MTSTEMVDIVENIECIPDILTIDDELKIALDKAVLAEVKTAGDVVTKQTIHLRVYKKVAKILNVNIDIGIDPKSIMIHFDNINRIDEKWGKHLQNNYSMSHEEMNAYDKIKSTDYVKIPDAVKFLSILVRKDTIDREDKEKILKSNDINILLGVDGFSGYTPNEMKNYIENLKCGSDGNAHVETVRKMYSLDIVKNLSGTDAACIIYLALLSTYKEYITDDQVKFVIDNEESDIRSYLSKNAKYYHDITNTVKELDQLVAFYKENVPKIAEISVIKIAKLNEKSKKRKNPTVVSTRGRKKFKIATSEDVDISKKRKRIVRPIDSE